jgi:hypothetical protein
MPISRRFATFRVRHLLILGACGAHQQHALMCLEQGLSSAVPVLT